MEKWHDLCANARLAIRGLNRCTLCIPNKVEYLPSTKCSAITLHQLAPYKRAHEVIQARCTLRRARHKERVKTWFESKFRTTRRNIERRNGCAANGHPNLALSEMRHARCRTRSENSRRTLGNPAIRFTWCRVKIHEEDGDTHCTSRCNNGSGDIATKRDNNPSATLCEQLARGCAPSDKCAHESHQF
jgi:hypothetical protein